MGLVQRLKQWGFNQLTSSTEGAAIKNVLKSTPRDAKILDVGCGYGDKIRQLKGLGFTNFVGVEKSPETLRAIRSNQEFNIVSVEESEKVLQKSSFDLIVFSHIIEHFDYDDLKEFIENYLQFLKVRGQILIITPTLGYSFYNDFDHVKPYNVQAINSVFI